MATSRDDREQTTLRTKFLAALLCCVACGPVSAETDTRDISTVAATDVSIVVGTVLSASKEGDRFSLNVIEESGACEKPSKELGTHAAMSSETGAIPGSRYVLFVEPMARGGGIKVAAKFRLVDGLRADGGSVVVIDIDNHKLVPATLPIHQLLQTREINSLDRETPATKAPPIVVASYALLDDFCASIGKGAPRK